jgi:hypothetical protein
MDASPDVIDSPPAPPSNVLDFARPFDPLDPQAEDRYDAVVLRMNRVRALRARNDRERVEIERQFVENDLTVRRGPRIGDPLTVRGRRQRIRYLVELASEAHRLAQEERCITRELDRMNEALDRWARDTYCP